jgi:UDP-N-acetylmuramate--alanine ligase
MGIERRIESWGGKLGQKNTVLMNTPFGGLNEISAVYFIGIGGIGMSALARFFHSKQKKVSGYDRAETELTKELEKSGIPVHYEENLELIPKEVELVVYTPAVPDDHKELVFYRENGYRVVKRSEVLQMITESSFNICVAGTHGKTTITTMIAHVLRDSGYGCNAFLGGIAVNYDTNFWSSENRVYVVEADEYDRSFLKLNPDIAVITAMDADHLDIYGSPESMEEAFIEFSQKVKDGGLLVSKFGLKRSKDLKKAKQLNYSLQNENADAHARNIKMDKGSYAFDVRIKDDEIENITLNMGGMHTVENAVAAIAVASSLEIDNEKIRSAIGSFKGVKRRFEYIIKNDRLIYIDDYAHHPEELRALINGAKTLFRQRKCTLVFQPHLYTRTRDLADGFAEALDGADEIILLPIYPARELPVPGVNSETIFNKMKNPSKTIKEKKELLSWIETDYVKNIDKEFGDVLITAGAGDIDMLVNPIKKILKEI